MIEEQAALFDLDALDLVAPVARISEKWGRFQHHVDYSPFQNNKLKPR